MELDAAIEPTIGPYEVYEDEWFNAKAAFEAFITVRDEAESKKLQAFSEHLQELENNLPIDPKYRNPKLGALAPIKVVNVVFAAGDGNRGVQTAAYNLPNDERVVQREGHQAGHAEEHAGREVQDGAAAHLEDRAAGRRPGEDLLRCLLHPHPDARADARPRAAHITVGGRQTTVRQELKETYSTIEEAKADVSGLWALRYLADRKLLDPGDREDDVHDVPRVGVPLDPLRRQRGARPRHRDPGQLPASTPARSRCARTAPSRWTPRRSRDAVTALTREFMTLQAEGNYAKAKDMLERLGIVRPEVQKVLDRLAGIPVDIEPKFTTAAQLTGR